MGDSTHSATITSIASGDTGVVHVPASVQREQGICIDDTVEVTIETDGIFSSVSFKNPQTVGDRITVPADVVRGVGLELGETYDVAFERIDEEESDTIEEAVESDETNGDVEDALDELEEATEETDDELDDDWLGELFG